MPLCLGTNNITKMYVGTNEVQKIYLGSIEIYTRQWTPSDVSPVGWYDAADASTITLNESNVSQWDDKSGNEHHVTQLSASLQPELVLNAQNNHPGLRFTTSKLENTSFLLTGRPWECHAVFKTNAWAGAPRAISFFDAGTDGGPGGWMVILQSINGGITQAFQTSHCNPVTAITLGQAYIQRSTVDSNAQYWINGVYRGQNVTANDLNTTDGIRIGNHLNQIYYQGDLYEIIITPLLSTTDRQKMEGYLAHKWGLTGGLPIDHLYKNSAPTI